MLATLPAEAMKKQLVFIDGIGGRSYMRKGLIGYFERAGFDVACFDYRPARHSYREITSNLLAFLRQIAQRGPYQAIGYSFGGILLRQVLQDSNEAALRPEKLVLLASPLKATRLCQRVQNWGIYKILTGDCGELVANQEKMQAIALPELPLICINGNWPWLGVSGLFFGYQANHDGMLMLDETQPPAGITHYTISASHAFLPQHAEVLNHIKDFLN